MFRLYEAISQTLNFYRNDFSLGTCFLLLFFIISLALSPQSLYCTRLSFILLFVSKMLRAKRIICDDSFNVIYFRRIWICISENIFIRLRGSYKTKEFLILFYSIVEYQFRCRFRVEINWWYQISATFKWGLRIILDGLIAGRVTLKDRFRAG